MFLLIEDMFLIADLLLSLIDDEAAYDTTTDDAQRIPP